MKITNHIKRRIKERDISKEEIAITLLKGDKIVITKNKYMLINRKTRLVIVFLDNNAAVTTYRGTKKQIKTLYSKFKVVKQDDI